MTDEQILRMNTEKAYQEALRAMFNLVNAITDERNYYRENCKHKEDWRMTTEELEILCTWKIDLIMDYEKKIKELEKRLTKGCLRNWSEDYLHVCQRNDYKTDIRYT